MTQPFHPPPFVTPFAPGAPGAPGSPGSPAPGDEINAPDLEAKTQKVAFPVAVVVGGTARSRSAETTVYTSLRRRRGLDVYVALDPGVAIPVTGALIIRVYARSSTGGARNLVASGMLGFAGPSSSVSVLAANGQGRWVCAARAIAETYEVTYQYVDTVTPFPVGNMQITCVASDESSGVVPDHLGAVKASGAGVVTGGAIIDLGTIAAAGSGTINIPNLEIVGVMGICTAAQPRYLLAFDRSLALAANTVPDLIWPLGATIGGGITDKTVRQRFTTGFQLAQSSDPTKYVAVADGVIQALVR